MVSLCRHVGCRRAYSLSGGGAGVGVGVGGRTVASSLGSLPTSRRYTLASPSRVAAGSMLLPPHTPNLQEEVEATSAFRACSLR